MMLMNVAPLNRTPPGVFRVEARSKTTARRHLLTPMLADLRNTKTPDGAVYNYLSIYNSLDGMDN